MKRMKLIAGNWKMNHSVANIRDFFAKVKTANAGFEAWIAPQFIHIPLCQELASGTAIKIGAQNCSNNEKGAFTGEVSPMALKDMGTPFVIIGHSERRAIFGETNALLNEKLLLALKAGLKVIFCVGETLIERESGRTMSVVSRQITEGMKNIPAGKHIDVLIAYEPVWAIGTGRNATSLQAQEVHEMIRTLIGQEMRFDTAKTLILYGGSVKPSNIRELLEQKDIDGALVGGASLLPEDFLSLCNTAKLLS